EFFFLFLCFVSKEAAAGHFEAITASICDCDNPDKAVKEPPKAESILLLIS
ncbi:MAG: hypothetical protein RIQ30_1013, partial [Pseudomonadota bacterium]